MSKESLTFTTTARQVTLHVEDITPSMVRVWLQYHAVRAGEYALRHDAKAVAMANRLYAAADAVGDNWVLPGSAAEIRTRAPAKAG